MMLLADSGSTTTRWAALAGDGVREMTTDGLNPRFVSEDRFIDVVETVRDGLRMEKGMETICFYGAGCGTAETASLVAGWLGKVFGVESGAVTVSSDLLGACRAVCGCGSGWVGILGTGSNFCYYNGSTVAIQPASTGFVLGDEGSGNHIGKRLLKDYLEGRMPHGVSVMFHDAYPLTTDQFLSRIYRQPYPNRFLASLAPFAAHYEHEEYLSVVLEDCFGSFFDRLDEYDGVREMPVHLVGGIAQSFARPLSRVAKRKGYAIGTILGNPMCGLIDYHRKR